MDQRREVALMIRRRVDQMRTPSIQETTKEAAKKLERLATLDELYQSIEHLEQGLQFVNMQGHFWPTLRDIRNSINELKDLMD